MRLEEQKRAAGTLQTIFVKRVSLGQLLVLRQGIFTYAISIKWT